uniref:Uncharacterized protein n=1 Tax=Tanacetum cinerariifolium TaxID=118510 RepID=A0A6L2NZZ1_TANCI|nr:hypothetical protein [Tanacetum cinerariifolium]
MSPPDYNNTYTKPPSENQILGFIKTLGYDEDPDTKMSVVSKMRFHTPDDALTASAQAIWVELGGKADTSEKSVNETDDTEDSDMDLFDDNPQGDDDATGFDHDALNAPDTEPSFHKQAHDNQDALNNLEEENKKKRKKDVGEPFKKSLRQKKSPVVHEQDDTPAIQPIDQEDKYI